MLTVEGVVVVIVDIAVAAEEGRKEQGKQIGKT